MLHGLSDAYPEQRNRKSARPAGQVKLHEYLATQLNLTHLDDGSGCSTCQKPCESRCFTRLICRWPKEHGPEDLGQPTNAPAHGYYAAGRSLAYIPNAIKPFGIVLPHSLPYITMIPEELGAARGAPRPLRSYRFRIGENPRDSMIARLDKG